MDFPDNNIVRLGGARAQKVKLDMPSYFNTPLLDRQSQKAVLSLLSDTSCREEFFSYRRTLELLGIKMQQESICPDIHSRVPFPFTKSEVAEFDQAVDVIRGDGNLFWKDGHADLSPLPALLEKYAQYYFDCFSAEREFASKRYKHTRAIPTLSEAPNDR